MLKICRASLAIIYLLCQSSTLAQELPADFLGRSGKASELSRYLNQQKGLSLPSPYSTENLDRIEEQSLIKGQVVVDQTIDAEQYYLGPGDELSVYLWGPVQKTFSLQIGPEGKVFIPQVGEINLRGKTLAQGRAQITEQMLTAHKDINLVVALSSIRSFKSFILGAVKRPGGYVVNGVTRVSDLMEKAQERSDFLGRRGIRLVDAQGNVRLADLALFYQANHIESNPYLREGERVFVPHRTEFVAIEGRVQLAGTYDYVHGDSLGMLIEVAGGFERDADSTKITVTRFSDNRDSLRRFNLEYPADAGFRCKPDDRIFVHAIPDYRVHRNVTIRGEVQFPGVYAIRRDKTRLADIIKRAGGITEQAHLQGSFIMRDWENAEPDGNSTNSEKISRIISLTGWRADEIPPEDFSYLKSQMLEAEGKMTVDFAKAIKDPKGMSNVILREGDKIVIARTGLSVRVMGAVVSPGLIDYKPDQDISYYIDRVGGYNERARRNNVMVKKVGTDVWVESEKVDAVSPGDIVLVTEKKYRDRLVFTRDFLSISASVATVILMFVTIGNQVAR